MNQFSSFAESRFYKHDSFERPSLATQYETHACTAASNGRITWNRRPLGNDAVGEFLTHDWGHSMKRFQLIVLPQAQRPSAIHLTQVDFQLLWAGMRANSAALWLVLNAYDGFHVFRGPEVDTYFVATSLHMLIWTYDTEKQSTCAFCVDRYNLRSIQPLFSEMLESHQEYYTSPKYLAYVISLVFCVETDVNINKRELSFIHRVEGATGYAPELKPKSQRYNIDTITNFLQLVGEASINLSNRQRHTRITETILDFVEDPDQNGGRDSSEVAEELKATTRCLAEAVPILRSRISALHEFIHYLKNRADRLSSVVGCTLLALQSREIDNFQLFALMTHEDAVINTELASSSRELAEAAKRDSTAMKTIAIMTMAFLPATFYAALFAVPLLDWNGDSVIQSRFWIYWAFTLPSTILVFIAWFGFANWRELVKRILGGLKLKES